MLNLNKRKYSNLICFSIEIFHELLESELPQQIFHTQV